MRKLLLWLAILGLSWTMPSPADNPPADAPRNIILVGWDGCHRDHVKALLQEDKLPNLKKLIDEGTLVDIDATSGATDTKAGWSQILTGYKPEVTGVYNNAKYRDVPAGYSIFERLKAHFGPDAFAAVAIIGKKKHCGEIDAPYVFLATNDKKAIRDGTRADIAPTIMDRFGLDLSKLDPKLDGESLLAPAVKPVEKAPATRIGK